MYTSVYVYRLEEELSDLRSKSSNDVEQVRREMSGHLDDVSKLRQCEEQMKKDLMQRKEDVER